MAIANLYKTCTKCKEGFPATLEYFYKDLRMLDGLNSWCKPCKVKDAKMRKKPKVEKVKVSTGIPKAIFKADLPKFEIGQSVRIGKGRYGKVSGVFKYFVVVDFKKYRESFLYIDIYSGQEKVK